MGDIITTEERIETGDAGIRVFVRNKRRADAGPSRPDRTVLFVHGATYASTITFDFPAGGTSWMDQLAQADFDCWLVDTRGYGNSDRPPEMAEPADANGPIVHTDVAIADLGRVVDHILAKRQIAKLQLIGYSWGTIITGAFTATNSDLVDRLALYGAGYLRGGAGLIGSDPPNFSYRMVRAEDAKKRWQHGLTEPEIADFIKPDWQAAWLDAAIASDPQSRSYDPPQLRAPTGVVDDRISRWVTGKFQYDPADITVPVLIVIGERDIETPPEGGLDLYRDMVNAPHRQYSLIGKTTHSAFVERRRQQLFDTVETFLEASFDG